jgi:hypothetical protein
MKVGTRMNHKMIFEHDGSIDKSFMVGIGMSYDLFAQNTIEIVVPFNNNEWDLYWGSSKLNFSRKVINMKNGIDEIWYLYTYEFNQDIDTYWLSNKKNINCYLQVKYKNNNEMGIALEQFDISIYDSND